MYVQRTFAMSGAETRAMLAGVRAADVITPSADGLQASFLPFVYEADRGELGTLWTHLVRVNPQWRDIAGEALVIIHGNEHHVTSDWLPAGDKVPTWNYETLHVYGDAIVHEDAATIRDVVARTTARFEPHWRVETADEDIDSQLRAIVAVEIPIRRVAAKAKLSQNRHPEVIESIVAGLRERGDEASADLVEERSLPVARDRQAVVDAAASRHRGSRGEQPRG